MTGPALVSTGPITSPAPHPPNVSNACGISLTPALVPVQVVHRVLEWAPPGAPPTAMILLPSLAIERQRASEAYPECGDSGTGRLDLSEPIRSSRGLTLPVAERPPTSSRGPDAVRVTGSTSPGSVTFDHVSVGPLTLGRVWLPEAVPGGDVQPETTSRVAPRPAETIAPRRSAAGPVRPRDQPPKPGLKNTPAQQRSGADPAPVNAS